MDIDILQKRLAREMIARKQAEELLERKSAELFATNHMLQSTAEQLSMQTSQLNLIIDHTLAGIMLVNSSYDIIRANHYAERSLGYDDGTLFGVHIFDFIDIAPDKFKLKISTSENDSFDKLGQETLARHRMGTNFPIDLSISETEIYGDRYTVWIFRDITKRKKQEADQKRLEDELRQALKLEALGTLASGIAHEINTPIQFVGDNLHFLKEGFSDLISYVEVLKRVKRGLAAPEALQEPDLEFLKDEVPLALSQSLDGISKVCEIVKSVRDFSHPGTKEKTYINLNASIESAITISTNQWKYFAEVVTDYDPNLPDVFCVPGEINQVVLNLIVNAAHAIEEAKRPHNGLITVRTRSVLSYVEIRISDTGCGIPEENRNKVFDPFFTTKEVGRGTGQGLALAHSIIVNKHGGKIFFESKIGEGTTFVILLPKKEVMAPEKAA